MAFAQALEALRRGRPVVIFDGEEREGEADIVFSASEATARRVAMLRKEAGGLVCVALSDEISEALGLPFMAEVLSKSNLPTASEIVVKRTPYGDRSAFSIPVNYKGTFTGITDVDRALTIKKLAEMAVEVPKGNGARKRFVKNFYAPGHVHLLRAARSLSERKGHTELAVELAKMAGIPAALVLCEMLDGSTGRAMSRKKAMEKAASMRFPFVDGKEIVSEAQA